MNILALSGSLRSSSSNSALVRAAAALVPEGAQLTIFEGIGELPHFNPDLDSEPAHAAVQRYRDALKAADAVFICTPEYAHGAPGVLKNALDWVVGSGELVDKPVALVSASPGADGGSWAYSTLRETLTVMNTKFVEAASMMVPIVRKKIDAEGKIIDAEFEQRLRALFVHLAAACA